MSILILVWAGVAAAVLTGVFVTRALLFRCVICRKCTWPWQECEPARYSDTLDEVHRACATAAQHATPYNLVRSASA